MSIALFVALCHNARKNTNAFEKCYQINKRKVHNSYESLIIFRRLQYKEYMQSSHSSWILIYVRDDPLGHSLWGEDDKGEGGEEDEDEEEDEEGEGKEA